MRAAAQLVRATEWRSDCNLIEDCECCLIAIDFAIVLRLTCALGTTRSSVLVQRLQDADARLFTRCKVDHWIRRVTRSVLGEAAEDANEVDEKIEEVEIERDSVRQV